MKAPSAISIRTFHCSNAETLRVVIGESDRPGTNWPLKEFIRCLLAPIHDDLSGSKELEQAVAKNGSPRQHLGGVNRDHFTRVRFRELLRRSKADRSPDSSYRTENAVTTKMELIDSQCPRSERSCDSRVQAASITSSVEDAPRPDELICPTRICHLHAFDSAGKCSTTGTEGTFARKRACW